MSQPPPPDFLIIGAAKCGTASLARLLDSHPDIAVAARKELRFFNDDAAWAAGPDDYAAAFAATGGARLRFEASPAYAALTEYPQTPARIASHRPDARLIRIARNPVARLLSHFQRLHERFPQRAPRLGEALSEPALRRPLVDRSRYQLALDAYEAAFGRDQVHTLALESALRAPETLRRLYGLLGVEPPAAPELPLANPAESRLPRAAHRVPGAAHDARRRGSGRGRGAAAGAALRRAPRRLNPLLRPRQGGFPGAGAATAEGRRRSRGAPASAPCRHRTRGGHGCGGTGPPSRDIPAAPG